MKVGIIATIGPSTRSEKIIREMIKNGMDIARLNFSWGTHEEHRSCAKLIRRVARQFKKNIPIIQDLSGPRIEKAGRHFFNDKVKVILTEKDLADLDFGAKQDIDYVALSYVGGREDILELRRQMAKRRFDKPVIAKIERRKALQNLDGIMAESDAVMLARGDLGNEIELEKIPYIQQAIIQKAKAAKKPVVIATGMMLSMMESRIPSRADVSDATWAILAGADAVMLSEETAVGKYPVEALSEMGKIIAEAGQRKLIPKVNRL